jgi:hypothetical protein
MKVTKIKAALPLNLKPKIYSELQEVLQKVHSSIRKEVEFAIDDAKPQDRHRIATAFIQKIKSEIQSGQIDFRMMNCVPNEIKEQSSKTVSAFSDMLKQHDHHAVNDLIDQFYKNYNQAIGIPKLQLTDGQLKTAKAKLIKYKWWQKIIYKTINDNVELLFTRLGLVGKYNNNHFVSRYVLEAQHNKDYAVKQYLNGKGLLSQRAKPIFYENLCFANGIKKYAESNHLTMIAITITAPGEYHTSSKFWNGYSPRQTHRLISSLWNTFNTRIRKWKSRSFYLRVVEPHIDGTPHWHVIFWGDANKSQKYKKVFYEVFKSFNNHKNGEHGIDWVINEDPDKISKNILYVLKSMEVSNDDENEDVEYSQKNRRLKRIETHAKFWNLRRWQLSGLPKHCKSLWRLMYRLQIRKDSPFIDTSNTIAAQLRDAVKSRNFKVFLEVITEHQNRIKLDTVNHHVIIDLDCYVLPADLRLTQKKRN